MNKSIKKASTAELKKNLRHASEMPEVAKQIKAELADRKGALAAIADQKREPADD